jgi:hypothetical protein
VNRGALLQAALAYASLGYRVFPCVPGKKRPLTARGFKDATLDPLVIQRWWSAHPAANVAIATDGLFVIDVDPMGRNWITPDRELAFAGCPQCMTPRDGRHFYFRALQETNLRCGAGVIAPGVDHRAMGGYVLVAPSQIEIPDGRGRYAWISGAELDIRAEKLPLPPAWLVEKLGRPRPSGSVGPVVAGTPAILNGTRNATLTSLAGTMCKRGMAPSSIRAALKAENLARCTPPLAEDEVERIAASVERYRRGPVSTLSHSAPEHGKDESGDRWDPIPITALAPAAPPEWIWEGYIARGQKTLLTALWKSGKSTLIGWLLHDLAHGGGLTASSPTLKILVVSEEHEFHWRRRRESLNLPANVNLVCLPFNGKASLAKWCSFIQRLTTYVARDGYGLVVLDTLASIWPVVNENDASEVMAAVLPLNGITQAGAALLLVHHPAKADGGEGRASRGSGALPGAVDIIVEMRRYARESPSDTRRVLNTFSRCPETPPEAVLELRPSGYQVLGSKAATSQGDRLAILEQLLRTHGPSTQAELQSRWPNQPGPGPETVRKDLEAGLESSRWHRRKEEKRGCPYVYWIDDRDSSLPRSAS